MSAALEDQARTALAAIKAAPRGAFTATEERRARWSAAVSLLAQAVAVFAEVAASGDYEALEVKGLLGDSALVSEASAAAHDLRDDLARLAAFDAEKSILGPYGDMSSGEYAGAAGQRRLVTIAAAVEERFPPLPPVGAPKGKP